uniref:progranulin-like n=1 Tax=Myxine glutinosa TaxID=7769 RepID=UPI00358FDB5B
MRLIGGLVLACVILPAWTDAIVICHDGTRCTDDQTCCELENGTYGCCPFKEGVCCPDKKTCCPVGTQCEPRTKTCTIGALLLPLIERIPALPVSTTRGRQDGAEVTQSSCSQAGTNCCPPGYRSNPKVGTCDRDLLSLLMIFKVFALPRFVASSKQENPINVDKDETKQRCADGGLCDTNCTCCKSASGRSACCPFSHAVCCKDKIHCCPENTHCDLKYQQCIKDDLAIPWLKKVPTVPISSINKASRPRVSTLGNITCPDGKSCSSLSTCCEHFEGDWACCPMPHAVCCKDHHHCCGRDTICDATTDKCLSHALDFPRQEMMPTRSSHPENPKNITVGGFTEEQDVEKTESEILVCPDGHLCPDDNTCCESTTPGEWGCCPSPHAVCCEDHEHCCPHFTTCDVKKGTCNHGKMTVPWFKKFPTLASSSTLDNSPSGITAHNTEKSQTHGVLRCNEGQFCGYNQTCCEEPNGVWGCCPFTQAVCCKDNKSCCPQGTSCDLHTSQCVKADLRVPDLLMFNNDLL